MYTNCYCDCAVLIQNIRHVSSVLFCATPRLLIAMIVGFLREFAEAEEFIGNASGAKDLLTLADQV